MYHKCSPSATESMSSALALQLLGSSHKVFEWLPSGHLASGPTGGGQRVQEATAVETLEARYCVNTADYSQHQTSAETHTLGAHTQRSDHYLKDTLFRGH